MNKKCLIIITMVIASAICFAGTAVLACDCGCGCTLTPGYWKTHSQYGPAPYDDTWANIGEDFPFYNSGKTFYEVINTPPKKGNAYYILSFQFIAVWLNYFNGASLIDSVDEAWHDAELFFLNHAPSDSLSKDERAEVIGWATILSDYNSGIIGPGHCDD
jgi:hypothetical protein